MRLIDADALAKRFVNITCMAGFMKRFIIQCVEDAPTIEAVPVRKGKWLRDYKAIGMVWTCSECGSREFGREEYLDKFCPHCGADMRGEKDE